MVLAVPELRQICAIRQYIHTTQMGTQQHKNHNRLLGNYPGMGPAKTGWTVSSRHTYAASATRNGRELLLIILNSANKWNDAKLLFDYGFSLAPSKPAEPKPQGVLAAVQPDVSTVERDVITPELPPSRLNAAKSPATKPVVSAPGSIKIYTVRKGDTLSSISRQFAVKMDTILAHNHITDPHTIVPGLVLYIPAQT